MVLHLEKHKMETLPLEIQYEINSFLNLQELSSLSLCNHSLHQKTVPILYRTLNVEVDMEGANHSGSKMMSTLTENVAKYVMEMQKLQTRPRRLLLCRYVKIISVCAADPRILYPRHVVKPICEQLAIILLNAPLHTFVWKMRTNEPVEVLRHIHHGIPRLVIESSLIIEDDNFNPKALEELPPSEEFPALEEFQCRHITTLNQMTWVRHHVTRNSVRRLHLGLAPIQGRPWTLRELNTLQKLIGSASLAQLTYLGLESFDLGGWPFIELPRLEHLLIKRCASTGLALSIFMHDNQNPVVLQKLSLTVVSEQLDLTRFLVWLSNSTLLAELCLLTGGCSTPLPLDGVLKHAPRLRRLVLESRQTATDPQTVNPYSVVDLRSLTERCSLLKEISLPICLEGGCRASLVSTAQKTECKTDFLSRRTFNPNATSRSYRSVVIVSVHK